jgi:hypothetical protein
VFKRGGELKSSSAPSRIKYGTGSLTKGTMFLAGSFKRGGGKIPLGPPFSKGETYMGCLRGAKAPLFFFLPPLLRDALPGEGEHKGLRYKNKNIRVNTHRQSGLPLFQRRPAAARLSSRRQNVREEAMLALNYLVYGIILLLAIGSTAAFSYAVVKNRRTQRAIVYARRILAGGQADSEEQFRDVYRRLATAPNDLEAAKLWKKLDELKDLAGTDIARNPRP